ncbi:unnamed protein product [Adineta steineri]|uniref:Uncharacterized protein n=1 Tax=Adineta steineri TaxID=433720 RepID=A0A819HRU4_9BILA|nr:unnamed protein product [Adineta steineri]CAF3901671.1 unnamed protein product [Adineta steineri]
MFNQIRSQFPRSDTVVLTGGDFKQLINEVTDRITMKVRVQEGFNSQLQDPVGLDKLLERQLQFKQVQLEKLNDELWNSLYWTHDLTRPDRLAKAINTVVRKNSTNADHFYYDSQAAKNIHQLGIRHMINQHSKELKNQSSSFTPLKGQITEIQRIINQHSKELKNQSSSLTALENRITSLEIASQTKAKEPDCVPFWRMPTSDSGSYFTYFQANTRISGDSSRSICVRFRVSSSNVDHILASFGSSGTTWNNGIGCNKHFALAVANATCVNVYGMCVDNYHIHVGPNTLYDGNFHQLCATYNNISSKLCVYRDLQDPTCIIRTTPYNTGLGDVRIGWWPDHNRRFISTGSETIKAVSLFDKAISQDCVAHLVNTTNDL